MNDRLDQINSLLDVAYYEDEAYLTTPIAKKMQKVAPDLKLIPTLKEKKATITEPLVIISGNEGKSFCESLAKTLSVTFAPCRVISVNEIDQLFETKLLIGWDSLLKELSSHIKEIPNQKEYFYDETPLILMPYLFYQKDPLQKKNLWNKLCRKIPSLLP